MVELIENADGFRYVVVEKQIMEQIHDGTLNPGDKLPSLRKLSSRLHVGLATVNQAYLELERKGVVEARPRSGFYVRSTFRKMPEPPCRQHSEPLVPTKATRGELIRTVLKGVGRKDILPFGVATIGQELLPIKALNRMLTTVIRETPLAAAQYESIEGNFELRRQIAMHVIEEGVTASPEEIIITSGCQEALNIALRALTRPGDIVLITVPAYYCFLHLLENLGLRAVEISSCPESGINPDDVRRAVSMNDVKVCIFNPNFNNPDGSLTPDEAKRDIVAALAEKNIPLIEDEVYADIHFGPLRPLSFRTFDRKGLVIQCSSFSKTLAPGYRVGWIMPGRFFNKIFHVKATTNICTATPTQMAVAEYLRAGLYRRHLKQLRAGIEEQMRHMQYLVSRYFPEDTKVTHPLGGAVLWLELDAKVDSVDYFYRALEQGIGVAPGVVFSSQDKFANYIRLNCGHAVSQDLEKGIQVLGKLAGTLAFSAK
ncbi:DNA-binding transcriptional regulator, MocR family, contains an aminotransferase domain [Desulfonatronum thiosulfatophilum]|uniref:DNA-binding transcriptional regulator, MocR family, contains an aminotransferase domain n=1 Tax=Desulfonatronum thiosulfatophilum TaxID=617002 RepID=A0A1G6ET61_9BACT|nr:PLP-dependent aminotransferase family protein [Desulfonatronum thiosulfatophilum]SDB60647.1 DNA-binding transcriptional regulator, MocR family, contains an aminotransferase domain [Desulfonatronum thiosulfatophilum]